MSKVIVEKGFGGDGAKAGLYIEGTDLVAKVSYPVEKVVKPVTDLLDPLRVKLEALIPGDWENALVDSAFEGIKKEILKLLTEPVVAP